MSRYAYHYRPAEEEAEARRAKAADILVALVIGVAGAAILFLQLSA